MDTTDQSTINSESLASNSNKPAWYCLRSQPKKEQIAVIHLRKEAQVDAFAPRISFYKNTRIGKKRFVEALFPGYVFVHCNISECLRFLLSMRGVNGVVRYGNTIPNLPDPIITDLIDHFPDKDAPIQVNQETFKPGDEVTVVEGSFKNLNAVIEQYFPAKERIQVLINFLGRDLSLTLPSQAVLPVQDKSIRSSICFDS